MRRNGKTAPVGDPVDAGADLSELYEHHGSMVRGLCRVLLRNRHEAEDAAQQTFLSAYRSMLSGNVPRHPAAWLATIARNECVARIQRRMREPLPAAESDETLPDPVAVAADRADLAELWQAIAELPERQRQALLLREFSGLSYSELAAALAVSEPAVESLLFRARDALRIRLQPAFGTLAGLAPLAVLRSVFARAADGAPDPAALGGLARIAGAPALAKVAVGAAAIVVAGGAVAVVERSSDGPRRPPDRAAVGAHVEQRAPAARPPVRPRPGPHVSQPQREQRTVVVSSAPAVAPAPVHAVELSRASRPAPVLPRWRPVVTTSTGSQPAPLTPMPDVPAGTLPVAAPGGDSVPVPTPVDPAVGVPVDTSGVATGPSTPETAASSGGEGSDAWAPPADGSGSGSESGTADGEASGGASKASAETMRDAPTAKDPGADASASGGSSTGE